MESAMAKLGYPPHTKPSRQPQTLEEGIHEIAYLRSLEAAERRRLSVLLKIVNATHEHVNKLERERLSLESVYIPVEKLPAFRQSVTQIPKTREEILASWETKSQSQIDKLIAELEAMKE